MEFPPCSSRGRSAEEIFVPGGSPPIQLLSRGIPPLSPSDSAAFHPNWPPASAHIYPNLLQFCSSDSFSRIWSLMNHGKHERRGLSIFCRWKRPGWHIFADNEKCLGFFTVGLPPAYSSLSPPPPQKRQVSLWLNKCKILLKSICASASALGISNRRTFEKHDKFQMYHKSDYFMYR